MVNSYALRHPISVVVALIAIGLSSILAMPVELDVMNTSGHLAPGMYPEVEWPVRRAHPTLFIPTSALARTVATGLTTLTMLMLAIKIPEPIVILAAGLVGISLHGKVG